MTDWTDPDSDPTKEVAYAADRKRGQHGDGHDVALDTEARLCLAREQMVMEMGEGVMTTRSLGAIAEQWATDMPGDRGLLTVGLWGDLIDGTSEIEDE